MTQSTGKSTSTPIWQPVQTQIEQTRMWEFMQLVNQRFDAGLENYAQLHTWSITHTADFWSLVVENCGVKMTPEAAEIASAEVVDDVSRLPGAKWFQGATLNFAENLLQAASDKTLAAKPALIFRGEDKRRESITYQALYNEVSKLAAWLRQHDVQPGDRVVGVMPNCIETVIAMLATTSLGAIWSSCSPDFGLNGILDRFQQVEPKVLFVVDGYRYAGKSISLSERIEKVKANISSLQNVVVVPFLNSGGLHESNLDAVDSTTVCYASMMSELSPSVIHFEPVSFDHPLYIMYSSGTTGVPKCIVHSVGGTLLQHRKEHQLHCDLRKEDVFFYFTTCGWMMWNWLVTGLAGGATLVLYDGSPFHPGPSALMDLIDEENISLFGTSAKYISALEKAGVKPVNSHQLRSLRTIFSTGSPLAHESFDYVYRDIKSDLCLSSISGGTDIVSCFALGNPVLPVYRGELQCVGLGMNVQIFNDDGKTVLNEKGELVCAGAFPSCPVGFWNDDDNSKFFKAYFDRFEGVWAHGDYGEITERGGVIIYGRSDAILNPGGVRIGTAEIYRQVEKLDYILESVAVGQQWQDDVRVILFVRMQPGEKLSEDLVAEIKQVIRKNTTPRHVPAKVIQIEDIPRTISGKIAELAVRNMIHNEAVKNTDALANPEALTLFADLPELRV